MSPSMFLNELCEYRSQQGTPGNKNLTALTFGWLIEVCLLSGQAMLSFSSDFVTFLRELQDTYKHLKVINLLTIIWGSTTYS